MFLVVVYGQLVSDRLPLWVCARNGGTWKPEYRLHALWIPGLICGPIGFGLFGAGLFYHLHWSVLVVAQIFATFGALACTPITVNYLCECFTNNTAETAIILNSLRVAFGGSISFYITKWVALMKFNWTYGSMACFQVFSFLPVILLLWKGHQIREWRVGNLGQSEEGEHVVEDKHALL